MKGRNWSPVGTRRRGLKLSPSRLTLRFFAVAAIIATYHCLELHLRYRDAMRAKYSPTQFDILSDYDQASLASSGWKLELDKANSERSVLLENRQHWKRLGGGREGEAFTFNNTVIKVYNEQTSPFRNCVPGTDGSPSRWPTEIPVSLIMGGHQSGAPLPNDEPHREMFVPVKDYFLASTGPLQPPKWHFVTQFLKSGTLKNLAKKLRASENPHSYYELDRMFRPSFESLLSALDNLHQAHNLCHDDVKLDNIFVASEDDPRQWKVGDLGNAREPNHPYHFSALWVADTPQLRDCRANDALRLTKVYLQFLRLASKNSEEFDEALLQGVDNLSRFYWTVARAAPPASAAEIREQSAIYQPELDGEETLRVTTEPAEVTVSRGWAPAAEAILGWKGSLRKAVKMELRVGASEDLGRLFGLTWIFGIPIATCQTDTIASLGQGEM